MKHIVFRQFFRDFCSAAIYPAVFLLSVALLVLLSAGCSRDDEVSGKKIGKGGAVQFTATGGTPSAITKSSAGSSAITKSSGFSADALSSAASLSGLGEIDEAEQTYTIYYDFEKGENVEPPQSDLSHDSADNLTQSSDTKFSGEVFSITSGYVERLDWVAGDKLTIFECVNGEYSNYEVKTVSSGSSVEQSKASLVPVTGNGLQWHDGADHKFVAMYPSIDDLGISSPTTTYASTSSSYSATINGYYTVIPHNQYCTRVEGGRTYKSQGKEDKEENYYAPDMKYGRMVASVGVASSDVPQNNLSLAFYPQFSSVEVKLFKPAAFSFNTVKLKRARLIGGTGAATDLLFARGQPVLSRRARAADFATTLTSDPLGGTITYSGGNTVETDYIYLYFKDTDDSDLEPVLEEYETSGAKPLSFTFLVFPSDNITQLRLELLIIVDGVEVLRTLNLRGPNGWIDLPAGKKLTITNMQSAVADLTPLTVEPIEAGTTTITINNPNGLTYKYSIDGAAKVSSTANPVTITASQGDKVALYQNSPTALWGSTASSGVINFSKQCYVYGNVMSLATETSYPNRKVTVAQQFRYLFRNNTNLRTDPDRPIVLPATTLANLCYSYMFSGCTGMEHAPALPATSLGVSCYSWMFDGCTGLKSAPELPASRMADHCYNSMFKNCTSLETAPELRADVLAAYCYRGMFEGCTNLKTPPPYIGYFYSSMKEYSCDRMFFNCQKLETTPELPVVALAAYCYRWMFAECGNLTTPPTLPAEDLESNCYSFMFQRCTSLTSLPELRATRMADHCYNHMFDSCTVLTTIPEEYLKSEELAKACYNGMFAQCLNLENAPKLPATTLADSCYRAMFYNCPKLTTAPELPARTMARNSYGGMFGYSGLTSVPELPATTLADSCYRGMFNNCKGLTTVPSDLLQVTDLKTGCYRSMFLGCSRLNNVPELPATVSAKECYYQMFQNCSSLNYIKCMLTDMSATDCLYNWVDGVASTGTFVKHPDAKVATTASTDTWAYPSSSGIPDGWLVETASNFTEKNFTVSADGKKVEFSPGNLQAVILRANSAQSARWQFADNQYDYPSRANYDPYSAAAGTTVDLFMHPESSNGDFAFGLPIRNGYSPQTFNFADWGEHLNIYPNSTSSTPYPPNTYRTLKQEELVCLLKTRESGATVGGTNNARYSLVKLLMADGTTTRAGLLIYPDGFTWDANTMGAVPNVNSSTVATVPYTLAQFAAMESAGVIFLPAAGFCYYGHGYDFVNSNGYYWAAGVLSDNSLGAHSLYFNMGLMQADYNSYRYYGHAVRLVKDKN